MPVSDNQIDETIRDWAKALETEDGEEQLLHELVQTFLEESSNQLADLRRAVREADAELVEKTAHSLGGALIYLGMQGVSQRARKLEQIGRERDLEHASEVLAIFETEVCAVAAKMRRILGVNHETINR
jgi:two-component system sensor histidine kinase/response regulator